MENPIKRYGDLSYERKTLIKTVIGLCFSAALVCGKFVIGVLTDYNLCSIALYTCALLLSKLECVLGVKSQKMTFKTRNGLIALFLFVSSVVYIGFTCRTLITGSEIKNYRPIYVYLLAFVSFSELGFAITGIFRTKNRGYFYRDIKIINFCAAVIAILTAQTAILDFTGTQNASAYNSYTGLGVGVLIAACAVYILVAPEITVNEGERLVFVLKESGKNGLFAADAAAFEMPLCKSTVYGTYSYRAEVKDGVIDGKIARSETLWKKLHIVLKVLCCILSEILIILWLAGRFIYFLRSVNLKKRLEKKMNNNGFYSSPEATG